MTDIKNKVILLIDKQNISEKQFTEKDLVDFGNYLGSDLRRERYNSVESGLTTNERLQNVSDADVQNFKETLKLNKQNDRRVTKKNI